VFALEIKLVLSQTHNKQHLKMSGPELEIVEVKSEPLLSLLTNIQNEGQPCPPNLPIESALADAKEVKRKTKKSALAGIFPCLIYNKEYMYKTFLTRHMVSKHRACEPIHQYRSKHCGAIFADETGFEKHKSLFFDFLRHHLAGVCEANGASAGEQGEQV
jgi:hypothetical protein